MVLRCGPWRRRWWLGCWGRLGGCGRLPWQTPPASRVPRIGMLWPTHEAYPRNNNEAFAQGLQELGYVEGKRALGSPCTRR